MNVVIVGSRATESLEGHLADSFRFLGHAVTVVDTTIGGVVSARGIYWLGRFSEPVDRWFAQTLTTRVARLRPNLVLVVYRHVHPLLAIRLKQALPGVVLAQLNPDALTNLEKQQIIATDFDFLLSKEPYLVDVLRHKAGLNAHYLPEGFNPRVHHRPAIDKATAEQQTNIDVLVYGTLYPYRVRVIEQLIRAGINVTVYGKKGPYLTNDVARRFANQYLAGDEKNRLIYGARIVLNTLHYAEVSSVNQKYFEINGIGGFQLCDYNPTIDAYTAVPAEAITYRTTADAIDKIRHFLAHPTERHDLADRQYAHFQQHHTFDQRVRQLLQIISLPVESANTPVLR